MRRRSGVALVVAVCTTAAGLTYAVRDRADEVRRSDPRPALPTTVGRDALEPAPSQPQLYELERLIGVFGEQVRTAPSATGFAFLGRLELERARLTGDGASYGRAEAALEQAVERAPTDLEAATLLATVRLTTHDFLGAYRAADRIFTTAGELGALAVRGDAELELGRYEEATADVRLLATELPRSAGVHVRLARLAFVHGRVDEALREAAEAERLAQGDGSFGATLAWYSTFRGSLALDIGRYVQATACYRRAVRSAPDYHVALAGLAAAMAARGRDAQAIALYRRAIAIVPEPGYLGVLGDLYARAGRRRLAQRQYREVQVSGVLAGTGAHIYDRQRALFFADHDLRLRVALRLAGADLARRPDVYGWDVLAWVLYKLGRTDEARAASDHALALHTPDAPLWYHAGMISARLGDADRAREELARALALSPSFDVLQARLARRALHSLGRPVMNRGDS